MASIPSKDNKQRHIISQNFHEKEHHKHNESSTIKGGNLTTLNQALLEDVTESFIAATYGSVLDVRGAGGYIIHALTGDKRVTKMRLPIDGDSRYMASYRTGLG